MLIADRIFNEFYPVRGDTSLELQDFEQDIDDILREINLHQAVKDRDKRLAKVIDDRTKEYFKFLKTKQDDATYFREHFMQFLFIDSE